MKALSTIALVLTAVPVLTAAPEQSEMVAENNIPTQVLACDLNTQMSSDFVDYESDDNLFDGSCEEDAQIECKALAANDSETGKGLQILGAIIALIGTIIS